MNKSIYSFLCTTVLFIYTLSETDLLFFLLKDNGISLGSHHSNSCFEQKLPMNNKISLRHSK